MSKWNWVHAGLQAATYHEMRQVRAALAEEAARRAIIGAMRHYIFNIAKSARLLQEYSTKYPVQVYSLLRYLQIGLEQSGIKEEHFIEVSDKEYLFKTREYLRKVIGEIKPLLSMQDVRKAEAAARYLFERPLLEKIIATKKAMHALQASNAEWKRLSARYGWRLPVFILLILSSFCVVPFVAAFLADGIQYLTGIESLGNLLLCLLPIISLLGGLAGIIVTYIDKGYKEYKHLADLRKRWHNIVREWRQNREEMLRYFNTDDINLLYEIAKKRLTFIHSFWPQEGPFPDLIRLPGANKKIGETA